MAHGQVDSGFITLSLMFILSYVMRRDLCSSVKTHDSTSLLRVQSCMLGTGSTQPSQRGGRQDKLKILQVVPHQTSLQASFSSLKLSKHISSSMFFKFLDFHDSSINPPDLHVMNKSRSMAREHSRQKSSFPSCYSARL